MALGAAAGFAFGVVAMVGYYVLGQFRGEPMQVVVLSTILCALVLAPCDCRWGTAGLVWANVVLALAWIGFYLLAAAFTGREFVVGGLPGTIVLLTALPLLGVGSTTLYVLLRRSILTNH